MSLTFKNKDLGIFILGKWVGIAGAKIKLSIIYFFFLWVTVGFTQNRLGENKKKKKKECSHRPQKMQSIWVTVYSYSNHLYHLMNNDTVKHLSSVYHYGISKTWNSELIQQSNNWNPC